MEVPTKFHDKYFERRRHDLETCLKSLAIRNYDEILKIGHQMKGSAPTFGHPELGDLGKRLEKAAKDKDMGQLKKTVDEFSNWLKRKIN